MMYPYLYKRKAFTNMLLAVVQWLKFNAFTSLRKSRINEFLPSHRLTRDNYENDGCMSTYVHLIIHKVHACEFAYSLMFTCNCNILANACGTSTVICEYGQSLSHCLHTPAEVTQATLCLPVSPPISKQISFHGLYCGDFHILCAFGRFRFLK